MPFSQEVKRQNSFPHLWPPHSPGFKVKVCGEYNTARQGVQNMHDWSRQPPAATDRVD